MCVQCWIKVYAEQDIVRHEFKLTPPWRCHTLPIPSEGEMEEDTQHKKKKLEKTTGEEGGKGLQASTKPQQRDSARTTTNTNEAETNSKT